MGCGQSKSNQYQIAQPEAAATKHDGKEGNQPNNNSNNHANNKGLATPSTPTKERGSGIYQGGPTLNTYMDGDACSLKLHRTQSNVSKSSVSSKNNSDSNKVSPKDKEENGKVKTAAEPIVEEEDEGGNEVVPDTKSGGIGSEEAVVESSERGSMINDKGTIIEEVDTDLKGKVTDQKKHSSPYTEDVHFKRASLVEKLEERDFLTAMETVNMVTAINSEIRRTASSAGAAAAAMAGPNPTATDKIMDKELGLTPEEDRIPGLNEENGEGVRNGSSYLDIGKSFDTPRGSVKITRNTARNSIFIERDDGVEREVIEITNSPELLNQTPDKNLRSSIKSDNQKRDSTSSTKGSYPIPKNSENILSKVLNTTLYSKYCDTITKNGHTLDQCIQPGVDYLNIKDQRLPCILALERDCYYKFPEIFDSIIQQYQPNYQPNLDNRPNLNPAPLSALDNMAGENFTNTRIFVYRNISRYQFAPGNTRKERREIESIVSHALNSIGDHLKGVYYSITDISAKHEELLRDFDLMITKPPFVYDKCQVSADWPESRGVWLSDDRSIAVIINELEHVKIIALKKELRFQDMFQNLCMILEYLEDRLLELGHCYVWSFSRGYIVSNPCYMGNALVCETIFDQDKSPQMEVEDLESIYISNVDTDKYKLVFDTYDQRIRIQSLPVFGIGEVEQFFQFYKFLAQISQAETNVSNRSTVKISLNQDDSIEFPLMVRQKSILAKVLTPEPCVSAYERGPEQYQELLSMMNQGIVDTDNVSLYPDGLVCKNYDSYDKFDSIIDLITGKNDKISAKFWKKSVSLTNFENPKFPFDEFISDFFIMAAVNMAGTNFVPYCSLAEVENVLKVQKEAFDSMEPKFAGEFYDFTSSQAPEIKDARVMSLLYPSWDPSKSFFKNWPNGRAFWISTDRTFLCWINETDHLKFFSFANDAGLLSLWDKFNIFMDAYREAIKSKGLTITDRTTFPTLHRPVIPFHLGAVISSKNENLNYLKNLLTLTGFQIVNLRINESSVELWVVHVKDVDLKKTVAEGMEADIVSDIIKTTFLTELKILMSKMSYLRFLIKHSYKDDVLDDAFKELKIMVGGKLETELVQTTTDDTGGDKYKQTITTSPNIKSLISQTFDNYPNLRKSASVVIAACLTPEMYATLSEYKTANGFTLEDCIRVGCDNPEKPIAGMIALDEECYDLYGDLVDCLIRVRSKSRSVRHVVHEIPYFPEIPVTLDDNYVYYLELGMIRNLKGFPLVAGCNFSQLGQIERLLLAGLKTWVESKGSEPSDHNGNGCAGDSRGYKYTSLDSVSEEEESDILHEIYESRYSLIFVCPQLKRFWPRFRGRWNQVKENSVGEAGSAATYFLNVTDHLQGYWSLDNQNVWCQFHDIYNSLRGLERSLEGQGGGHTFLKHPKYGYVTTCPYNLGSGFSIKIRYKLPNLLGTLSPSDGPSTNSGNAFYAAKQIINNYNLRVSWYDDQTLEVITSSCFGYSEVELLQQVIDCTKDLIRKEMELNPVPEDSNDSKKDGGDEEKDED